MDIQLPYPRWLLVDVLRWICLSMVFIRELFGTNHNLFSVLYAMPDSLGYIDNPSSSTYLLVYDSIRRQTPSIAR